MRRYGHMMEKHLFGKCVGLKYNNEFIFDTHLNGHVRKIFNVVTWSCIYNSLAVTVL